MKDYEAQNKFYNEKVLSKFTSLLVQHYNMDEKEASIRSEKLFKLFSDWAGANCIGLSFFISISYHQRQIIIAHFVDEKINIKEEEKSKFIHFMLESLSFLNSKEKSMLSNEEVKKGGNKNHLIDDAKQFYSILKTRLSDEEAKAITDELEAWTKRIGIKIDWLVRRPINEIRTFINAFMNNSYPFGIKDARDREEYYEVIIHAISNMKKELLSEVNKVIRTEGNNEKGTVEKEQLKR